MSEGNQSVKSVVEQKKKPQDRLVGLRKLSVASDGGSFCTAFGSYFVLLHSCLPVGRPDGCGGSDREARLLG